MDERTPIQFEIMDLRRNAVSREDAFDVGEPNFHVFGIIWIEDIPAVIDAYNIVVVVYVFAGSRAFSGDAVFGDI
jgi:hypothetical protein